MNTRQAKKILNRWSRTFDGGFSPKVARELGIMPWTWPTWVEAHRVWARACRRTLNKPLRFGVWTADT